MNVTNIRVFKYQIPFKSPLHFTGHTLTHRQGCVVALENDQGQTGYGEIAPLEGLHKESLESCIHQLRTLKPILLPKTFDYDPITPGDHMLNWLGGYNLYPSVQFGLDMAAVHLIRHNFKPRPDDKNRMIAVNALVDADLNSIETKTSQLIEAGYKTIKMKVGRNSVEKDIACLKRLQQLGGTSLSIRLDANRKWSFEKALAFAKSIDIETIEYIEEPIHELSKLLEFHNATQMPIGLDETLAQFKNRPNELPLTRPKAFILKPSVIGKLSNTFTLKDFAGQHGIQTVISSAFESGLSHSFYTWLASLNNAPHNASGLDTINYLADDILQTPFTVKNGFAEYNTNVYPQPLLNHDKLTELSL